MRVIGYIAAVLLAMGACAWMDLGYHIPERPQVGIMLLLMLSGGIIALSTPVKT